MTIAKTENNNNNIITIIIIILYPIVTVDAAVRVLRGNGGNHVVTMATGQPGNRKSTDREVLQLKPGSNSDNLARVNG